jgi:hypothetical protein
LAVVGGCPFCQCEGEDKIESDLKQRRRRHMKRERSRLKLGKWWKSYGYEGPKYCQRCSEVFRDHIMRQLSNSAGCGREHPCTDCTRVLEWLPKPAAAAFERIDQIGAKREAKSGLKKLTGKGAGAADTKLPLLEGAASAASACREPLPMSTGSVYASAAAALPRLGHAPALFRASLPGQPHAPAVLPNGQQRPKLDSYADILLTLATMDGDGSDMDTDSSEESGYTSSSSDTASSSNEDWASDDGSWSSAAASNLDEPVSLESLEDFQNFRNFPTKPHWPLAPSSYVGADSPLATKVSPAHRMRITQPKKRPRDKSESDFEKGGTEGHSKRFAGVLTVASLLGFICATHFTASGGYVMQPSDQKGGCIGGSVKHGDNGTCVGTFGSVCDYGCE